ncbi:unnamed protein product [Mucor fragilis]
MEGNQAQKTLSNFNSFSRFSIGHCTSRNYINLSHPAPDTALDTGQGTAQGTAQDTAQDAASSTQKGIAITGPLRKKRNIDHVSHDEIDALFNSLQDHEEEEIGPVCLRDQPSAVLRPPLSHYIINDINVSRKFYEYQLEDKAVMETHGFVIETSAFELLSLSSIMLLKPRQYSSMIRNYFTVAARYNGVRYNGGFLKILTFYSQNRYSI